MGSLRIANGTILTMNDGREVVRGDLLVRDGRIEGIGPASDAGPRPDRTIDASGALVLPGFVQTHLHLCQTLFRGFADDLPLLEWLRRRVWPLEAAHDAASLRASAWLACAELVATGTTAILTMETVHDTDAVCEAVAETGLRATIGKCMMDRRGDAPPRLTEDTRRSIDESVALFQRWHGAADGRMRIAYAPRFAVSCTRELLEEVAAIAERQGALVHTHASENRDEVALVRTLSGMDNVSYLADTGLASPRLCAAHCVWVSETEQALIAERGVRVLHCPGSNLKLGSGLAPVAELRARGVSVSLGADGAACNNRLDMFDEMRLAATLQAVRKGPGALTATDVVWMATREGARALGLDEQIGSIEPGKLADIIVVDVGAPHLLPGPDPYSTLVYAARGSDVRTVVVGGEILLDDGRHTRLDVTGLVRTAREEAARLAGRAGL